MISRHYTRTGTVAKLSENGGWWVLWDEEPEPIYHPWGLEREKGSGAAVPAK